jgi:hypothetical protein
VLSGTSLVADSIDVAIQQQPCNSISRVCCVLLQFLLSGTYVDADSIDAPKWAAMLAETGYDSKEGWNVLMTQLRVRRLAACGGGGGCMQSSCCAFQPGGVCAWADIFCRADC